MPERSSSPVVSSSRIRILSSCSPDDSTQPRQQEEEEEEEQRQQQQQREQPSISRALLSRYNSISSSRNDEVSNRSLKRSNHLEKMLEHREKKMKSDAFLQLNNESSRTVTTHGMLESSDSNLSFSFNPHDDSCGADEVNGHLRDKDHKKRMCGAGTVSHDSNNHNGGNDKDEGLMVEVETKEKFSNSKSKTKHLCFDTLPGRIGKIRETCGRIVNNERVQLLIILMIVVNAVMMGIGTFDFVTDDPDMNAAWETTDQAFLIIFTVELAMQLVYHGAHLFADGWLVFDFFIVVISWSLESLQVIRAFRVFRAFRLVTRMTILKNLVLALFAVAPSMGAIMALLVLILYIYGVMCTVLFNDLHEKGVTDKDYFGRLDKTLFTLFEMMTLTWSDIVRQVMVEYYWAWCIFSSFLVLTSFILYSLIVAVVCDAVSESEHHDDMANALDEKTETRLRLRDLQAQVDKMAVNQAAVMAAIQHALEGLEDDGGGGAGQPPDDAMLERNGNRRQRHVTYNLEPGHDVKTLRRPASNDDRICKTVTFSRGARGSHSAGIEYVMSLSDDEEGNGEPVLVFETDSDIESYQQIKDSDPAAAEVVPQESRDILLRDEQHRSTNTRNI